MKSGAPYDKIEIILPGNSSIYILAFLLFLVLGFVNSCGKGEEKEAEVSEAPVSEVVVEGVEDYEGAEDYMDHETDTDEIYDTDELTRHFPRISTIKIVSVSQDLRDGFHVVVETDNSDAPDTEYIYEWKINGEEIIGAAQEVLQWQDGFKKGDSLSVGVIPVSDIGQGVWKAEGSMVIPNSPPEIISEPGTLFEDGKFSYTVEALDPDGDTFDITLSNAPRGMIIEPAAGLITWEYGSQDGGDYEVLIIVTDSEGAQVSQALTFTIHPDDSSPLSAP